jgi:hypothetical protein
MMNKDSSRSHCMLTITVEVATTGPDNKSHIRCASTCLLARAIPGTRAGV